MAVPAYNLVAVVTGCASVAGRRVVDGLAGRRYKIVLVYLDDQKLVEAALREIQAGGAAAVGVRADLDDEVDIERLFMETMAVFGPVDVVIHVAADDAARLEDTARRHLSPGGAILRLARTGDAARDAAALLAQLDSWRSRNGRHT
jgi:NAD(P)-dependent dehydrogenase (short-subunit alcohol dehydrogenase family)